MNRNNRYLTEASIQSKEIFPVFAQGPDFPEFFAAGAVPNESVGLGLRHVSVLARSPTRMMFQRG